MAAERDDPTTIPADDLPREPEARAAVDAQFDDFRAQLTALDAPPVPDEARQVADLLAERVRTLAAFKVRLQALALDPAFAEHGWIVIEGMREVYEALCRRALRLDPSPLRVVLAGHDLSRENIVRVAEEAREDAAAAKRH